MKFSRYNPYPISRNPVYAKNGMVAILQPLAAQAGSGYIEKRRKCD